MIVEPLEEKVVVPAPEPLKVSPLFRFESQICEIQEIRLCIVPCFVILPIIKYYTN